MWVHFHCIPDIVQGFPQLRFAALIFVTLFTPGIWTLIANEVLYPLIHNIHRSAMAAYITTGVDTLPEEIQVNVKLLEKILHQPPLSHSATAIYAADSWASDNSTTKDVYDMIVKTSREVSSMCRSFQPAFPPHPAQLKDLLQSARCGST